MNRKYDLTTFIDNLWLRENAEGLKAIEGKGGYRDGRYFPYTTPNGNVDVGPGFDLSKQTPEFVKRAYSQGYTKQELDSIARDIAYKEISHLNERIIKEGGDTLAVPDNVYNGLLDMYWQIKNGVYKYDEFWKGVAQNDYQKMRDESATYYEPTNGIIPKGAVTKNGKVRDTGRWEFRKNTYFREPPVDNNTLLKIGKTVGSAIKDTSKQIKKPSNPLYSNGMFSFEDGGQMRRSWDELSMSEKADIMKLAIEGGVYDLDNIKSGYNAFAKGGSIHIDPSKKGTFTAAASKRGKSVQEFASQVLAHEENYSPAMVKKANFARNASRWKHDLGGNLYSGEEDHTQQLYTTPSDNTRVVLNGGEVFERTQPKYNPRDKKYKSLDEVPRWLIDEWASNATASNPIIKAETRSVQQIEEGHKALESYRASKKKQEDIDRGYSILAPVVLGAGMVVAPEISPILGNAINAGFVAHGTKDLLEGNATPFTALELAPVARVAKPIAKAAKPVIENKGFAVTSPFTGNINWVGTGIGSHIKVSPTSDGWLGVDYIKSTHRGIGKKMYDAAIKEAHKQGLKGVKSGEVLYSAPKTYNTWKHYPDKVYLGDYGLHTNSGIVDDYIFTQVNSPEELVEATKKGINAAVIKKGPVYGLTTPTQEVPLLSLYKTKR